jgi:hypothetical protein
MTSSTSERNVLIVQFLGICVVSPGEIHLFPQTFPNIQINQILVTFLFFVYSYVISASKKSPKKFPIFLKYSKDHRWKGSAGGLTQTEILSRHSVLASKNGFHGLRSIRELLTLQALLSTHLECSLFWKVKAYQFLFNSTSSSEYPSLACQASCIQSRMVFTVKTLPFTLPTIVWLAISVTWLNSTSSPRARFPIFPLFFKIFLFNLGLISLSLTTPFEVFKCFFVCSLVEKYCSKPLYSFGSIRAEIKPLQEEKGTADGPDSEETRGSVPSLEGWPRRVSSKEVRPPVMDFTHSRSVA